MTVGDRTYYSRSRNDWGAARMEYARPSVGITQNANDCPPDRAEAVWGAGSALVGYTCVTPSAN
jgi:hypothetical protein